MIQHVYSIHSVKLRSLHQVFGHFIISTPLTRDRYARFSIRNVIIYSTRKHTFLTIISTHNIYCRIVARPQIVGFRKCTTHSASANITSDPAIAHASLGSGLIYFQWWAHDGWDAFYLPECVCVREFIFGQPSRVSCAVVYYIVYRRNIADVNLPNCFARGSVTLTTANV